MKRPKATDSLHLEVIEQNEKLMKVIEQQREDIASLNYNKNQVEVQLKEKLNEVIRKQREHSNRLKIQTVARKAIVGEQSVLLKGSLILAVLLVLSATILDSWLVLFTLILFIVVVARIIQQSDDLIRLDAKDEDSDDEE